MDSWKSLLCQQAVAARERAYCPYSHFAVGAALLCENGKVYTGCNIESAAYSPSICAERTAFAKAVSEGERNFTAIAIVGGEQGKDCKGECPPCGVCRQVMMEFCDPKTFLILLVTENFEYKEYILSELLPFGFGPGNLL